LMARTHPAAARNITLAQTFGPRGLQNGVREPPTAPALKRPGYVGMMLRGNISLIRLIQAGRLRPSTRRRTGIHLIDEVDKIRRKIDEKKPIDHS